MKSHNRIYYSIFLIFLTLFPSEVIGKRSSGGSFSRGNVPQSNSRPSGQSSNSHSNSGWNTNSGFQPAGNPRGMNNQNRNFQQPNNFNNQPNNFHQPNQGFSHNNGFNSHVNVPPQKSTGQWKTALAAGAAGAIGGMLLYEGTKAIIKNAAAPFNVGGKDYFWGNENYKQQNGMFMCSIPLEQLNQRTKRDVETTTLSTTTSTSTSSSSTSPATGTTSSPNNVLQNVQFANGDRPKNVVWSCKQGVEVCCGMNCCPNPQMDNRSSASHGSSGPSIFSIILFILFTLLLIGCCTCALIYCFCKSLLNKCMGQDESNDQYNNQKYENNYSQEQPSYPMQNYPQGNQQQYSSYPHGTQQHYPSYPSNQGGYPSNNQPVYPSYN
uniref:CX domain-containing protein n=1 Tax=Strongyloides venezuelensis TaxID=75913 RepID=A0A0K0F8T3_STRVS